MFAESKFPQFPHCAFFDDKNDDDHYIQCPSKWNIDIESRAHQNEHAVA